MEPVDLGFYLISKFMNTNWRLLSWIVLGCNCSCNISLRVDSRRPYRSGEAFE